MSGPYDDIIDLPHLVSAKRKRMSYENRAAQFAPFAALSGYDSAISETSRITSGRVDLSPERQQELSRKLNYVLSLPKRPAVSITFFSPDRRKSGGMYVSITGNIKKVELCYRLLILTDGTEINLDDIYDISGDIFDDINLL